jgi:hypothetical protein
MSKPPKRHETTDAVRSLALDPDLAGRLTRRLDRAFCSWSWGRNALRDTVHEIAHALQAAGMTADDVGNRLERLAVEHARERGWVALSLVTRRPRYADLVHHVGDWARGSPRVLSHPRRRRVRRATTFA